jgi:S1-C subfamily serine protease
VSNNLSGDVVPVTYARNGEASTLHLPLHAGVTRSIAKYRSDDFPTALEYSPPVRFTANGGPLIDLAGRVIGITVGASAEHAGWAIPADCVRRLIAAAKRGELSTWPE